MHEAPEIRPLIATSVRRRRGIAVASVLIGVAAADPAAQQSLSLVPVADIPLGGNTTRLDYESLDPGRHLLFIAHLGDSAVIVFDIEALRVITRIPGISKVHGVLAVPELGKVYASATGTNEVVAIDEATLK
jgi:DNA-binding beta-propeller fold protein YncE